MTSKKNPGRFAGLLYLLTSIVRFFTMGYVPGKLIVHGNAAATANNISVQETLFRLGIVGQLIGMAGFIFVAVALYDLLKGVNQRQAWLMVLLIVVSIPVAFLNELNSVAAIVLVRGADFLSMLEKPQREALAMLFLKLHGQGLVVAEIFWGLWLFPLATLVYRSRFLPRFLGVWLTLAGFGWVILSLTSVLLPQYQDKVNSYSQPAFFGETAFMLWLVIKGAKPLSPDAAASSPVTRCIGQSRGRSRVRVCGHNLRGGSTDRRRIILGDRLDRSPSDAGKRRSSVPEMWQEDPIPREREKRLPAPQICVSRMRFPLNLQSYVNQGLVVPASLALTGTSNLAT